MKKHMLLPLFVIILIGLQSFFWQSEPTFNEAEEKLFKENKCRLCHRIDKDKIGPSYLSVAEKYSGKKEAIQILEASIKAGSKGKWGKKQMPAYSDLDKETLTRMAKAILHLKHN